MIVFLFINTYNKVYCIKQCNSGYLEMNHISSLHIQTYRGIQNLQLNDFSLVNIFTGDNNTGKTSVLEILRTLPSPLSLSTWLANGRKGIKSREVSDYEAFTDLFNVNSQSKIASFNVVDSNKKNHSIILSAEISTTLLSKNQINKEMGMVFSKNEEDNIMEIETQLANIEIATEKDSNKYKLNEFSHYVGANEKSLYSIHSPVIYISPTKHAENILYLDKILNNPQLYEEMLAVLKDFDSDIVSINASTQTSESGINTLSNKVYYNILSKDKNRALPLNMYGDGMKKAILLMSAVVAAKGGILLLDEFETAIHTSAMADVLYWIINTCKKLDVQLFMTTHSLEALKTVLNLSDKFEEEISLYTLYKKENTVARRLTAKEAIEASDILNLELR